MTVSSRFGVKSERAKVFPLLPGWLTGVVTVYHTSDTSVAHIAYTSIYSVIKIIPGMYITRRMIPGYQVLHKIVIYPNRIAYV